MTLVLTELSNVGIVMAADSAITRISGGRVTEVDEQGWTKLLRVPTINSAISYWGMIGSVTQMQFDLWLRRIISSEEYDDLESFARLISNSLNDACNNQPLADGKEVGIHVAGYSQWPDGEQRPVFFHVHNGHGRFVTHEEKDDRGRLVSVNPKWESDPRKLFEVHQDFPSLSQSQEQNIAILDRSYITRNGDFYIYATLWEQMQYAFQYINLIPNVSIPRDSSRISSRKGFLHTILEMIIRLYRCSNQSRIIGGTVVSLGIGPNGYIP